MSIGNKVKGMGFAAGLITGGTSATAAVLHLLVVVPTSADAVSAVVIPPPVYWLVALMALVLGNIALFRLGQKALSLAQQASIVAQSDELTSLQNRRALTKTVRRLQADASISICGVLTIDLTRFKSINDQLGHAAGDRVLQQVALRIGKVCGPTQQPFRLGGDEFAIFVEDLHHPDCLAMLKHDLEAAIATPIYGENWRVVVECSIGHAVGAVGLGIDRLMQAADQNMYLHKKTQHTRSDSASIQKFALGTSPALGSQARMDLSLALADSK